MGNLFVVLAILAARILAVPPLSDPVSGLPSISLRLSIPPLYLLFAPLFSTWDGVSMLSMSRLRGFLLGLVIFYVIWRLARLLLQRRSGQTGQKRAVKILVREILVAFAAIGGLALFIVVGLVWHRPMLSLTGVPPNLSVVDFHSHTNLSHDVDGTLMRGYDAEANRRWHARAGFDAVFVTDHNVVSSPWRYPGGYPALCSGTEVSAWGAHLVLLGDTLPVADSYRKDLAGLMSLLHNSESAYGSLTLASLPEYQRNHWSHLSQLIAAGLDGFEIVNASPKANEISRAQRDTVIELARRHNLFIAGVSDSHGWGATSMVWNLVATPAKGADLCARILAQLRLGFPAVQIVERHRLRPDDRWPLWLTPVGVMWETWRSMGRQLTLSWLAWTFAWLGWRWKSRALAKGPRRTQDS